jgi:hypothetical protein
MADGAAIPVVCQYCDKPVTLISTNDLKKRMLTEWHCPWCNRSNATQVAGRIIAALVGHVKHM